MNLVLLSFMTRLSQSLQYAVFTIFFVFEALSAPSQLTYQGRLYDSSGEPVESDSVSIVIQMMDPLAKCLLYEESHIIDMAESSGFFSIQIGAGTQNISTAPSFTLSEALSNATSFNDAALGCPGDTYTPSSADQRVLRVVVDGDTLTPDQAVNSSPYALYANESVSLGGKSLVQIESEYRSYASSNWAGTPLPNLQTTPLVAGDSFKWDGAKWVVFQPGSATGLTDVLGGAGLTESGTTTKTIDLGAGDGITVNADDIAVNAGDGLRFNAGALEVNLGSGLQFNAGAIELNQSVIDYSNLSNTPMPATIAVDGLMSAADKAKLDNIAASAEVNVNADWNAVGGDAQILNKPSIPSDITELTVGNDSISGDKVDGGTISGFASIGIDDNAVATAMTIDSSGNVGVGTSLPMTTLHLAGANPIIRLEDNVPLGDTWDIGLNIDPGGSGPESLDFLIWNQSGDTGLIIERGGNMGIGTKNPNDILHVAADGDTFITTELLGGGANTWHVGLENNSPDFRIRDGADDRIVISASGDVGIGTATPNAKMDVAGDIKIGDSLASCDATTEGSQRYNSTSKKMEFCNGTLWAEIGGGGTSCRVCVETRNSPYTSSEVCTAYSSGDTKQTSSWTSDLYTGETAVENVRVSIQCQ